MDTLFKEETNSLSVLDENVKNLNRPKIVNEHQINHRFEEKYHVLKANTERMRNSTVPYIQRLLNTKEQERKKAAPSL